VKTQSFRFRGGVVRIAAFHGSTDVASLALRGRGSLAPASVQRLLERVRDAGYREVVTNALAPAATLALVDAGFSVRDRLRVLAHDLDDVPAMSRRTRRARRTDRDAILAVDAAAFDDFWRLDGPGLDDARRATRSAQLRVNRGTDVTAYALFGRAGNDGYVQRLAVAPAAQGHGLGAALVGDGLAWLAEHGARQAFVNTQTVNDRAYALYRRCGFEPLPVGLCVLGREL
jgi:ribosomal protein S18 acetylase RimI-like enzyme